MPTVRRYERQVSIAPLRGGRRTAAETPASQGAGVARARAQKDLAIAGFGEQMGRVGQDLFARIMEQARDDADRTALLKASNQLSEWKNRRLYDTERGAFTLQGEAAQPLPETIRQEFDDLAGKIEMGLSTDRQRQAFANLRSQEWTALDLQVRKHVAGEMQRFRADELKALVDNSVNAAIASASDPRLVAVELTRATSAIQMNGPSLGLGREAIAEQVRAVTTKTHMGVIGQLIAQGQDRAAAAYFEATKDQIAGDRYDSVLRAIEAGTSAGEGLRASEEIWRAHGPKSDADPIQLDRMEDAARARFRDTPKVLDATIARLRERKAATDAGRQDRQEALAGTLWRAAAAGTTVNELERLPEYVSAPGALQRQVRDYVVSQAEHRADRAHVLSERAYAVRRRQEAEQEQAGWARMWEVSRPETLTTMTENQILGLIPELGVDHVNRLMTQRREYVASATKAREATIDQELFNTLAQSAGLQPYKPQLSEREKSTLGQLRNAVESAIASEQGARNRTLTRDEKQAVMQRMIDRRVMLDRWGTDPSFPAAIVNPDDREQAYVPLEQIPEHALTQWVNVIRSTFPREQQASRDAILRRYRDRIQRAHAAAVLGLGSDEERRRLGLGGR